MLVYIRLLAGWAVDYNLYSRCIVILDVFYCLSGRDQLASRTSYLNRVDGPPITCLFLVILLDLVCLKRHT